jgi:hypothetical protein
MVNVLEREERSTLGRQGEGKNTIPGNFSATCDEIMRCTRLGPNTLDGHYTLPCNVAKSAIFRQPNNW